MTSTILKTFWTGQITIPKQWRQKMNSDFYHATFDEKNWKITFTVIINKTNSNSEEIALQTTSINSTNKE